MERYAFAFIVSMAAGLATGIGGVLAVFLGRFEKFLPFSLGFSAGVMVYMSFVELFQEARELLTAEYGASGEILTAVSFFIGMMIILLIDHAMPSEFNIHKAFDKKNAKNTHLLRVGVLTMIGIAVHNFPEGIATFTSALQDTRLGFTVAMAVAIHNIPEGIAIAAPIYSSTGSSTLAIKYAFVSGLAEPAGALVSMAFLARFMNDALFGVILAAVAGIMVFIALDELLPSSREYGDHHLSIFGLVAGMALIAVALLVL